MSVERWKLNVVVFGWLLPILTGILLALAFPPGRSGELAWLALLPLLFAIESCARGEAFRRGYLAGLVFFGMTVWWTIHVTLPGMVALVAFLALYFGLGALWWNELFRRFLAGQDHAARNLFVAVAGTAGWVTLEWVRGKFLFGGFGWNGLGVSQYRALPLIQIASVTGVAGLTALLGLVNFTLYFTVRRTFRQLWTGTAGGRRLSWEFYVAMLLVCAAFLGGLRRMQRPESSRQLRLALVQANIPQSLKFDPGQKAMILAQYRSLTEQASVAKPDLIIWPESATPEPLRYDPASFELATNAAISAGAHLLTGTLDEADGAGYNAAFLVTPDGKLAGGYRKMHLVPFGEYVPLRKVLPFLKWLTPIGDSFERGREPTVFEMRLPNQLVTLSGAKGLTNGSAEVFRFAQNDNQGGSYRFGAVICFEDTVPDLYRRFVARGVDFMVNLTNDAWFKDSPAAEQHLANAVFRAVETRRPLVRCTNNGVSAIVNEFGFISARLAPFSDRMWAGYLEVPSDLPVTPYVRYGDWFVGLCAWLSALVAGWLAWRIRRAQPAA